MARFVLDTSTTMAWCFEDEANVYADAVLAALPGSEVIVPSLWLLEVSNVLLVAERRNRIDEAARIRSLELLLQLPITVHPVSETSIRSITSLAAAHDLSSYDAAYVDLAMREGVAFATSDDRLKGKLARCGVTIFDPRT